MDAVVAPKKETSIHFDSTWCEKFLDISEDANRDFHSNVGKCVVQGIAIIAKVNKIISEVMEGYGVAEILNVKFYKQIRIGDTVEVNINTKQLDRRKIVVEVVLLSQGTVLVTGEFVIVPMKFLERAARRQ